MVRRCARVTIAVALLATSCSGDEEAAPEPEPGTVGTPTPSAPAAASTAAPRTAEPTAPRTTRTAPPRTGAVTSAPAPTSASAPPTTAGASGVAALATDAQETVEIGRSVEGRPIVAVRRGTAGGTVVLVIGVIHGDEDDGVAILERLATAPVPHGVDLWLIESINPDGQAAQQRGNAAGVDLNRNFPYQWGPIGEPGDSQYAGTGPASEPETRAVVEFVTEIRPALGLWYHQDLYRLSPGDGFEGELKARYSELTGVPILPITGGTYTGVAATWQRNIVDGISFIVELGPSLRPRAADRHAAAVLDLAAIVAAR